MIKAALLDFDGTLVSEDLLSFVSELVGKKEESLQIDHDFWTGKKSGLTGLIERINLLKGISVRQIEDKLATHDALMLGAKELIAFCKEHHIITIVSSGNILPILNYYKKILQFDYVVGSSPVMADESIVGISEEDYKHSDYKLFESKKILSSLGITADETIAIGDTPGDKSKFLFSKFSIAINPKEEIEKYATQVIRDDLRLAIPIIEIFNIQN